MPGVNDSQPSRRRAFLIWGLATTSLVELATVVMRFGAGLSAVEFNKTAPLLLQIHHMFWSIPLFLLAPAVWRWRRLSGGLLGVAAGLIASDLIQHFVVLPLVVGNTGWHWP